MVSKPFCQFFVSRPLKLSASSLYLQKFIFTSTWQCVLNWMSYSCSKLGAQIYGRSWENNNKITSDTKLCISGDSHVSISVTGLQLAFRRIPGPHRKETDLRSILVGGEPFSSTKQKSGCRWSGICGLSVRWSSTISSVYVRDTLSTPTKMVFRCKNSVIAWLKFCTCLGQDGRTARSLLQPDGWDVRAN